MAAPFAPEAGRPRPAYRPQRAACPHCGAPLEVKDERSRLLVCGSCGSHLEANAGVSEVELRVLSQQAVGQQQGFALEVGDGFVHDKARYEVIGRLAIGDAEEPHGEPTLQYLLFHPRRGSLWLSSYQGHWDLSETSRVLPASDPRALRKGGAMKSHDGHSWLLVEKGDSVIRYVDGAMPWLAKVGDRSSYAELLAADGSGELYEVEYRQGELEVGRGRRLSVDEVRRGSGKNIAVPSGRRENIVAILENYRWMVKIAVVVLLVNLVFTLTTLSLGGRVLDQKLDTEALRGEALTQPFEVAAAGNVIEVAFEAPLNNAWMSIDWAVVRGEDEVIHVDDGDLEYYHGVEGGESWSEGSRSSSHYLKIDAAGSYRILVRAVSAQGEAVEAQASQVPLRVRVYDGVRVPWFAILALVISVIAVVIIAVVHHKWKTADEEEDD